MSETERGFTIVELMIATSVFAVVMLISAAVVVRMTSGFQRSLVENSTQDTARSIIDTVSQSIQFSGAAPAPLTTLANGTRGYCFGSDFNFSYILGKQLGSNGVGHVLVERSGVPTNCGGTQDVTGTPIGQELIAPNMRLAKFDITSKANNLWTVTVKVAYGDDDLLCSTTKTDSCDSNDAMNFSSLSDTDIANLKCKSTVGSQYCAVSELSTTVQRRL